MAGPFPTSPNDGDLHTTDGGTVYQYKVDRDRWVIYKTDADLDDLNNVNSAGKEDGDALIWDVGTSEWIPGEAGGGTDEDAIHDNVAGEIVVITEKTAPVGNDEVVIEDSQNSNNKKSVKLTNLGKGIDHQDLANRGEDNHHAKTHNNTEHSTNYHTETDGVGVATVHSDITSTGSQSIITTAERNALHTKYTNAEAVSAVEAAGLALASARVITSADEDIYFSFGRAGIGYMGTSDVASFAHRDKMTAGNVALRQTADGLTYLGASGDQSIKFAIGNTTFAEVSASGLKIGVGATVTTINTTFVDNDTSLMTSQAIKEKITNYGYLNTAGVQAISINNLSEDTSPTLGGTLDGNNKQINSVGDFAFNSGGATVNIINMTFSDNDTSLMTSQAIKEKIETYDHHAIYTLESHNNTYHSTNYHTEAAGTGVATVHSDITNTGSQSIITTAERNALHTKYTNAEAVSAVEAAGLALASARVITSADEDILFTFGRAGVGYASYSDYAAFGHRDRMSANNPALRQNSAGLTYLNASAGQSIKFTLGNTTFAEVSASGLKIGVGATVTTINTGFTDNDTSLMTSQAVKEKITSYGYLNTAGVQAISINNLSEDSTPQLGADLDLNQKSIDLDEHPDSDHTGNGMIVKDQVTQNSQGVGNLMHITTNGDWIDADKDAITTIPCLGMAMESGTGGGKGILLHGFFRDDSWNWVLGVPLFVGDSGDVISNISGFGSGDFVQIIGFAIASNVIYFNPDKTFIKLV